MYYIVYSYNKVSYRKWVFFQIVTNFQKSFQYTCFSNVAYKWTYTAQIQAVQGSTISTKTVETGAVKKRDDIISTSSGRKRGLQMNKPKIGDPAWI